MVLEIGDKVIGFMIYSLHKDHLHLDNLGIDPNHQQYKSELIQKLKSKLSAHRRTSIRIDVAESNLGLLLFLKSHRFQPTIILHDQYQLSSDDTYVMEYRL